LQLLLPCIVLKMKHLCVGFNILGHTIEIMFGILIDNGHGIETPGKRSPDGKFLEYYYNRIVASRVTAKLQNLGFDAYSQFSGTGEQLENLELHRRAIRARQRLDHSTRTSCI